MFVFFKSNKEKAVENNEPKPVLKEVQEGLKADLDRLRHSPEENSTYFEEVGLIYYQLSEDDLAIEYLEKAQTIQPALGERFKALITLYNRKRVEAAKAGNDDAINVYMNKLDELRQVARKHSLGGN